MIQFIIISTVIVPVTLHLHAKTCDNMDMDIILRTLTKMTTNKPRIILVFQRVAKCLQRIDPDEADLCIAYGDGVSTAPKLRERVLDRLQMGGSKLVLKDKASCIDVDVEDELIPALRDNSAYDSLPSLFTSERTDTGDIKVHLLVIDERQPSGRNDSPKREKGAEDQQVRRASGASSTRVAASDGSARKEKEKPKYAAELNNLVDKLVRKVAPVEEFEVI